VIDLMLTRIPEGEMLTGTVELRVPPSQKNPQKGLTTPKMNLDWKNGFFCGLLLTVHAYIVDTMYEMLSKID